VEIPVQQRQKNEMFTWLATRSQTKRKAREIYGAVVAQARTPVFYSALGVADTPEGRYELIALHLVLVLDRLGRPDIADEGLRRETLETFVTDMDDAMRQMGVGDPRVPQKVKRAAAGLYDRGVSYSAALADADDAPLKAALSDNVYRGKPTIGLDKLATYVRKAAANLTATPAATMQSAALTFPDPETLS
jgi:cytochrome b pre-mRNA-processing protein 3